MIGIQDKTGHKLPFGQYEYVDVTFQRENTDTIIPYTRLVVDDPEEIRYLDIRQEARLYYGADEYDLPPTIPTIYRLQNKARKPWGPGYIVLRCNVPTYTTRLLLFTERNEASSV